MLFNYGAESNYTRLVESELGKSNVEFLKDYIEFTDFRRFYNEISAIAINSYRQLALANIFLAIEYGVKIYLNKKNVISIL